MDISSGQSLDLENTTFGCRICNQTGHLQGTCSLAKKPANKRKGPWTKTKIWQPFEPPFPNNEEEVDLKDLPSKDNEELTENVTQYELPHRP